MLMFLYLLSSIVPLPFWILLIFFTRRKVTKQFFGTTYSYAGFLVLGGLYIFTLFGTAMTLLFNGQSNVVNFGSPDGLAKMFQIPALALVVWLHMITMDLAGGFFIYRESERLNLPLGFTKACLVLTFLLGPLGMFIFGLWRVLTAMRESSLARALAKQEQQLA